MPLAVADPTPKAPLLGVPSARTAYLDSMHDVDVPRAEADVLPLATALYDLGVLTLEPSRANV